MSYELNYDLADADQLSITNQIYMSYLAEDGRGIRVRVRYNRINGRRSAAKHRHLMIDEKGDTTLYFRQGAKNFIVLSSRKTNPTDYLANRVRLEAAYLLSRWPFKHKSIVLYEKMSSRYEESASVVYERLIDMGIKRAYYILDKDSYDHLDIDEKYKKNIVIKNSLKHYYLFFAATSFIGTETIPHCIEIRTDNRKIRTRLKDPTLNYVFLQHGVMYMVSLDSASRSFFRPRRTTTGLYRVVTSSQLEKRHFVERGRYNPELLYVCGLPKYDRNQWYDTANKILVMLTWRPWEENTARLDFENTGYYQLMKEIIESVPENLRDKVILITHPLFQQYLEGKEYPLKKYVDTATSYDELLRDTKVLITDYSSIAYDAFYRGANVLFYWKDKDECMEAYGEGTELMINEDNVFGDTCYQVDELSETLERNYWSGHSPEHEKRYERIVEFHDGKNTDRLVEFLKEDGII